MSLTATTWLPTAELTSMRAEATLSLPDVGTLRRFTSVSDSQGGQTRTWSDLSETYCRLVPRTGAREQEEEGRLAEDTPWLILLPHGTTAARADRLRVSSIDYELTAQEDQATEPLYVAFMARRVV